jgi:DNA-binding NtrC family response regulator
MSAQLAPDTRVLLIDDEPSVLLSAKLLLQSAGLGPVTTLEDSREALDCLERQTPAAVVLDLFMPFVSGTELLSQIVQRYPGLPVIVMTAAQDVETAVRCMKEGAFDYLVKPVEESRFVSAVEHGLQMRALRDQIGSLKRSLLSDRLNHPEAFDAFVTGARKVRALFHYLEAVARSSEPILIMGESGVGKGLLAEAAHRLSGRRGRFVELNVAGTDDALFSDTLFGHRKGAFTGAFQPREGLVAQAMAGTLFLDEIGDLAPGSQVKLLRLLQERTYLPLGSDVPVKCDVRIICATNRDLDALVREERFRCDLYFRLSVHRVEVPPLRDRLEDIPFLLDRFITEAAASLDKTAPAPAPELLTLLGNYHFPGNVRELRAMVFDAIAQHLSGPVLGLDGFRRVIERQREAGIPPATSPGECLLIPTNAPFPSLKDAETALIHEAMERAQGNQGIAATLLGISRPALNRRLRRLGADTPDRDQG